MVYEQIEAKKMNQEEKDSLDIDWRNRVSQF
jgi:hypothetical protein